MILAQFRGKHRNPKHTWSRKLSRWLRLGWVDAEDEKEIEEEQEAEQEAEDDETVVEMDYQEAVEELTAERRREFRSQVCTNYDLSFATENSVLIAVLARRLSSRVSVCSSSGFSGRSPTQGSKDGHSASPSTSCSSPSRVSDTAIIILSPQPAKRIFAFGRC